MDVVQSVQNYIAAWDKGGEADCRNVLTAPHCNPSDPGAHDLLSTVYHTLISATLLTWSPKHALAPQTLVAFVQSVLEHLPSPSSVKSSNAVVFGEILVDVIWSIDVDVDEIYQDAKLVVTNAEQGKAPQVAEGQDPAAVLSRAAQAKQSAESDKEKLAGMVKQLVTIGILDADICRERLELSVIFHAGLIPDDTAFMKKEIRARTALFYKQNKFNLLREQSEGYSKLTTELTSSLGPANSPASGLPVESASAIEARARPAWERVVGLVGYFDLDPNRALDIILDVFSTHLASHYAFFLSLLSCSPWAPTPTEDHAPMEPSPDMYRGKDLDDVLKLAERSSGRPPRAPPSPGSMGVSQCRVLAQVLGFKFVYYQLPDVAEHTPRNLYLTAALLIREGFITVEDLSPHITPANEEMDAVHKKYLAACNSRIAGAKMSALAMAAPLETTSSYGGPKTRNATPAEAKKPEAQKEMPNQRLGLLHALLSVGALRPAISIISKFPWMVDAFPELSDLMIRVLNYSINDIYESAITFKKDTMASFTKAKPRFGSSGLVPAPDRKPHITLIAPKPPPTSAINFVFFFPEWTQYIPVCSTTDDLIDVLEPLMRFIGPQISRDHTFLTRFLRTGRPHITSINITDAETKKSTMIEDKDNPVRKFWTMVVRRYLLPALCLTQGNAVSTVDIWNIVKMFDVHTRWRFYGEWKSLYKTHPELRVREIQVDRESKGVLRRLSVKTVESLSGTVAKLAHSNPYIFFANVVNQVMAYDNLANVIIASLTHVTVMGFDVLLYIVLDALANPHKERVKQDGINTSDWLQSLASFIGLLFRRFNGDLTYLLQYIVHQLQGGQTSEIVVLRELIWKMAGIEPLPSLGDSQIAAMAGGPVLRIEAVASEARGARLDPEVARFRGPQRLGEALISTGLALPLLIQVAQQRQDCVYQAHDIHLKSLASLFDTTHGVFLQYLDLLATPAIVSAEDYSTKVLPSLKELNQVYGISAPICMQVYRPVLNSRLLAAALSLQEKEKQAAEEAEKRLKAALTAKREPGAVTSARNDSPAVAETSTPTDGDGKLSESKTSEDVTMEVNASEATPPAPTPPENPWVPDLYSLFDDVKAIAPGNAIDVIGPGFYLTFWQLSTYDLTPPTSKYEDESNALRSLSRQEDGLWLSAERSSDRTRRNDAVKHRQRRERYNNFISLLGQEMKEQTASRSFTIKRLAKEKNHWFSHSIKVVALASALIEHCLHPRALLSPMDADFCAQIIKVIHAQGTPNFSTLHTYDKILGEHVSVVLCSCSEYEARNYGRFLLGILTDISRWAEDEQLFMQDNRVKTGGKVTYLPGFMMRYINKPVVAIGDIIQWKDLRAAHRKWHKKLLKCFIDCIETGKFMHVYNAIVVMKELLPVFPSASVHDTAGMQIDAVIEKFLEKEERADLKILGMSYQAGLKRREPHWAMPTKPAKPATPAPATKLTATSAPPEKPRTPALPSASSSSASQSDARRPNPALATPVPSAPRAHVNGTTPTSADKSNTPQTSIKAAIESIPRPEVVKRIRPDTRSPAPPKVNGGTDTGPKAEPMNVDTPIPIVQPRPSNVPTGPRRDDQAVPRIPPSGPAVNPLPAPPHGNGLPPIPRNLSQQFNDTSRPPTPGQASLSRSLQGKDLTQSPRLNSDLRPSRSEPQAMPPPSAPSQTSTAQELRETAKQSRPEDKPRPSADSRGTPHPPTIPSPSIRRRSPSPLSRAGTRNASAESRASGGRSRAATTEGERGDEKRPERESRHEPRESRRDGHGRGRNAREGDREKDKEAERDRDRRDRHGDRERARDREPRERERERDRGERDREGRERERDREPRDSRDRERDRERDRDRGDRHRRDDKERDRDGRKERDGTGRNTTPSSGSTPAGDDRGLPSRPDVPRRREEESLGKRRRPVDDDSDRASKRVSRKESHHEDRSRRSSDKDGHERARDTDRRRKERDAPESESRGGLSIDTKLADKRIPDGPASARALPPSTPSGPRAMASTDPSRSQKAEPWPASSARTSPTGPAAPSSSSQPQQQEAPAPAGSLRARISEKEAPPPRTLPRAPSGYRGSSENTQGERGRGDVGSLKDDSRDGGKKRASSERDNGDGAQGGDPGAMPLKRPRINRNRYNMPTAHAFAKKVLPIDADKTRGGRKD